MIYLAEFGLLCLIGSFAWPLVAGFTKNIECKTWIAFEFLLLTLGFVLLAACFLLNDYSVLYVYKNSFAKLPWFYRICAVWGAHEGSWLLWTWLLAFWALIAVRMLAANADFLNKLKQNLAFIFAGFTGYMVFASNPFARVLHDIPTAGIGLNPLLQDPGMIVHPPLLYSGYVGLVVVFALALAAIRQKKYDLFWLKPANIIARLAWIALTLGIVLGSWWAYRELGWGGFWGWDPVENASLLPWLTSTAFIHLLTSKTKQRHQHQLLLLFSALNFFLSILGTFLLRSGLVISVHAFAEDPTRGLVLLTLLAVMLIICLYFAHKRLPLLDGLPTLKSAQRLKLIHAQVWLFAAAAATVLLGTLYPLIAQVIWHENLSVGAPYFNEMLLPNLLICLFMMCQAVFINQDLNRPYFVLGLILSFTTVLSYFIFQGFSLSAVCFALITFVTMLMLYIVIKNKISMPMLIAHFGFLIMLQGVVISSSINSSHMALLQVGESIPINESVSAKLVSVSKSIGPNYEGSTAQFQIGEKLLLAEERQYTASNIALPKVGILTSLLGSDIYLAFAQAKQGYVVRSYYKPLIRWIWLGGLLMAFGAILALRRRV